MEISDRELAGLRGPVALCETEQPERGFVTRESFRRDGKRTDRWHRNPDGSEWTTVRRYDPDGRLFEEEQTGPPAQTLAYRYDAQGRLERIDVRLPDGTERVQKSYLYYADQTSAITEYIDPPLREKKVTVSVENMLHMSVDAVCIMTIRDSGKLPIKKVLYDADGRVIRRVLFRYDGNGRLVEEGEIESGDKLRADMRNSYRYDTEGRCIEAEFYWGEFGGQRKTRSYNEQGDLKEERVEPLPARVALHETAPWSAHYDYEYDARGNWTSRTEQVQRLDSGAPIRSEVTRRKLKYWDASEVPA